MNSTTRKEWRRQRLIALLQTHFDGNQAALADKAGIAATLISRYINGGKGIGESMRDKIEINTGHPGWFDEVEISNVNEAAPPAYFQQQRTVPLLPPAVTIDLDPDCLVVWRQLQLLSEREREEWRARLDHAAANARLKKLGIEPPSGLETNAPPRPIKARDPA